VGVAIDGDKVYVAECNNHRVSMFNTEEKFLKLFGHRLKDEAKAAQFQSPHSVHVNKVLLLISAIINSSFLNTTEAGT